jgi:hypothetical protein
MKFLNKFNLSLLVLLVIGLNVLIYYRAMLTIEPVDTIFAECARNSGRTSAALNLVLLFMLGHFGLKSIFKEANKKKIFTTLVTLFAVNHLIHFFFVTQNFKSQVWEFNISDNLHGLITFISLLLLPAMLFSFKSLNRLLYISIIIHFFNVTYFICDSFYVRYKPEIDEAYLHRLGVFVMIAALLYVLYRVFAEHNILFTVRRLDKE